MDESTREIILRLYRNIGKFEACVAFEMEKTANHKRLPEIYPNFEKQTYTSDEILKILKQIAGDEE